MQDRIASKTALATAAIRAAHQLFDERPLLFEDPVAVPLLGERGPAMIRAHLPRHQSPGGRALRSHVCLRSRYAEDRLADAVAAGVACYVLVGAGFDTFAWRQPAWARKLRIVEVDHPATQFAKRRLIARAGLGDPGNVTFAPADFTRQTLDEVLARHDVRPDRPACFSWLGVSMYLEEAAIEATLRAMAAFAPGSGVTLTFKQPPPVSNEAAPRPGATLARRVAGAGEAFISFFTTEAMAARLRQCGFTRASFLTPDEARATNFTPPRRDLPVPAETTVVFASRS